MKKINIVLTLTLLGLANFVFAQIGIGTDEPRSSTALDVVSSNKGILLPRIKLTSTGSSAPINNIVDGIMIYNITSSNGLNEGVYFWKGAAWHQIGESTRTNVVSGGSIPSVLGYNPTGTASTAGNITINQATFTKTGCKQWPTSSGGNGHYYCAYTTGSTNSSSNSQTWETAFKAAKGLKGYLVTFTTAEEWNWVKTNIIDDNTGYNLSTNIWIGINKTVNSANTTNNYGIPIEFYWVSGESSQRSWSNTSTSYNNFDANETSQNNGCVHIWRKSKSGNAGSLRQWNDQNCTSTRPDTSANYFTQFIFEFEQ